MVVVMKKRNVNLDLIRFVAILSVISVHFIRNIGFYGVNITGFKLSITAFFRTLFMICVPLFLLLTGYLMNKKELSKKYYLSIFRIIFVFIVAKAIYLLVDHFYFHNIDGFVTVLRHIFSYSNVTYYDDYSWYVNMYFGLFLLIPFLNLIYNNLKTKKQKQILILTLLFLTSVSALNIKNITFIPDWWGGVYPLTYYFIGTYIKEYGFNLKKSYSLLLLISITLISTIFYLALSYNKLFITREFNDYRGPGTFIISILAFGFLLNLNLSKIPSKIQNFITKVSELSFGMYLFSYIVDKVVYDKLNTIVLDINDRFIYGFLIIPLVFLLSLILSLIVNSIYSKFIHLKLESKFNNE